MNISSTNEFIAFQKPLNCGDVICAHFYADYAEECEPIKKHLACLAENAEFSSIKFINVEAEKAPEVSLKFNVSAVPTVVYIQNNKEIARVDGADPPAITEKLRSVIEVASKNAQTLTDRLKDLISKEKVMLFMKGSPDQPRCGFSKTTVGILREHKVSFGFFDILSDQDVRQGLKEYSDWPTYPQLYIDGELVGGLDIIRELVESGEFDAMVGDAKGV